jgi:chemotaxis protein MotB
LLGGELKTLPNALLIEGHTDATPYSSDATYTNWELSADRANAARRLLQQDGVRGDQVTQVRGYADQLLRIKTNPFDPTNRRISILVKNDAAGTPPIIKTRAVAATGPEPKPGQAAPEKTAAGRDDSAVAKGGKAEQLAAPPHAATAGVAKPGLLVRMRRMLPGTGR